MPIAHHSIHLGSVSLTPSVSASDSLTTSPYVTSKSFLLTPQPSPPRPTTTFTTLPFEILGQIYSYLPLATLGSLRFTSRRLHAAFIVNQRFVVRTALVNPESWVLYVPERIYIPTLIKIYKCHDPLNIVRRLAWSLQTLRAVVSSAKPILDGPTIGNRHIPVERLEWLAMILMDIWLGEIKLQDQGGGIARIAELCGRLEMEGRWEDGIPIPEEIMEWCRETQGYVETEAVGCWFLLMRP